MDTPASMCKLVIVKVNEGLNQRCIANQLLLSQSAVARIILRYNKTKQFHLVRKGRYGRRRLLSLKTEHYLARESQKNPRASARQIQRTVAGEAAAVSINTIKRALVRSGRLAFRPVKSPSWTEKQMKFRLEWALKYRNWSVYHWKHVSHVF